MLSHKILEFWDFGIFYGFISTIYHEYIWNAVIHTKINSINNIWKGWSTDIYIVSHRISNIIGPWIVWWIDLIDTWLNNVFQFSKIHEFKELTWNIYLHFRQLIWRCELFYIHVINTRSLIRIMKWTFWGINTFTHQQDITENRFCKYKCEELINKNIL